MRISFSKSETQILEQIRSGDEKAMERIYHAYRSEFLIWSMDKYNVSEDDALDHYQDAVTIFFEKVSNGMLEKIESTIKTYLFGIGKNKIRQKFQKDAKADDHLDGMTEHYQFLGEGVENHSTFEEAKNLAVNAFNQLGESCKKLLKYFYFEKKSMIEISKLMGHKNEGVSRTSKKRCLEKIREQLKNTNEDG
ncbi:RNA polymerase sigma factor [Ekhidna sp.]